MNPNDVIHNTRLGSLEDASIFTARGIASDTGDWQQWQKPRNAKMVFLFLVGGGAGGGGGFSAAAGNTRGGGGGGATGSVSRLIIPAFLLPDIFWCHPGKAGLGGAAGVAGGNAGESYVCVQPDGAGSTTTVIARSGLGAPAGGGAGTGGASGSGGSAGGQATATVSNYFGAGIFQANNGQAGTSGGSQNGTPGQAQSINGSILFCGGTGGGGTGAGNGDNAGGSIGLGGQSNADIPGGVAAAGIGNPGVAMGLGPAIAIADLAAIVMLNNLGQVFFTGGTGGGTAGAAGIAGKGGKGAYGCGGGGGGGGVTGGAGGDGGDGFIIVLAW